MANAVAEGAKEKGAEVTVFTAADFNADMVGQFNGIAFGCPAMGAEVLEESEFEPMFTSCGPKLGGKGIALFGSYGWGTGEWMQTWEATCDEYGASLVCDSVICNEAPNDAAIEACKALGAAVAG